MYENIFYNWCLHIWIKRKKQKRCAYFFIIILQLTIFLGFQAIKIFSWYNFHKRCIFFVQSVSPLHSLSATPLKLLTIMQLCIFIKNFWFPEFVGIMALMTIKTILLSTLPRQLVNVTSKNYGIEFHETLEFVRILYWIVHFTKIFSAIWTLKFPEIYYWCSLSVKLL